MNYLAGLFLRLKKRNKIIEKIVVFIVLSINYFLVGFLV